MKTRIISAFVAIALFFAVLFASVYFPFILNIVIALIAAVAVWEVANVSDLKKNRLFTALCMAYALYVPFGSLISSNINKAVFFAFAMLIFAVMLKDREDYPLEKMGFVFMLSLLIPHAFNTLLLLKNKGETVSDGLFLLLLCCAASWLADTGAYFSGRFFGKHKLAPVISPKKTVEGFIGGIVVNILGVIGAGLIYQHLVCKNAVEVNLVLMGIIGLLGAVVGPLGDLSASLIKRNYGAKDYGNIMPGHGGVLDRFDSVLMVAPCVYVLTELFDTLLPILTRV